MKERKRPGINIKKVLFFCFVITCLGMFVGCDENGEAPEGELGGPCYGNGTCNSGLECVDDICVPESDGDDDDDGEGPTTTTSIDVADEDDDESSDTPPDGGPVDAEAYTEGETRITEFDKLPVTLTRFEEAQEQVSTTPQGAAAMFIIALRVRQLYPAEGLKCLVTSASETGVGKYETSDGETYDGYTVYNLDRIDEQLKRYPRLPYAYYKGATPENNYEPDKPYIIEFPSSGTATVESGLKLFVATEGADSDRPISVVQDDDGLWRAYEWSSLLMGLQGM